MTAFDDDVEDTLPMSVSANPQASTRSFFAWGTALLVAGMVLLTAIALFSERSWFAAGNAELLRWGGNSAMTTLDGWNWWRLLGAKFQLGSTLALVTFIPFFWVVSAAFERRYGPSMLLSGFVALSVISSLATLYVREFDAVSIGAGGPALGLGACLFLAFLKTPKSAMQLEKFGIRRWLLAAPYLALLVFALSTGTADYASLGAGLLCGMLLGAVLLLTHTNEKGQSSRVAVYCLTGLVIPILVVAGTRYAPHPPYYWSEAVAFKKAAREYESEINPLNARFDVYMKKALDEDLPPSSLVPQMEAELLPAWRLVERRWDTFVVNPSLPDAQLAFAMKQYPKSRLRFLESTFKGWTSGNEDHFIEAAKHKLQLEQARLLLIGKTEASQSDLPRK